MSVLGKSPRSQNQNFQRAETRLLQSSEWAFSSFTERTCFKPIKCSVVGTKPNCCRWFLSTLKTKEWVYILNIWFCRACLLDFYSENLREVSVHVQQSTCTVLPDLCMNWAEYLWICDKMDVSRTHCTYCLYTACKPQVLCPYLIRLIGQVFRLRVWLSI